MPPRSESSPSAPDRGVELESVLNEQLAVYARMLALAKEHRDAIAQADPRRIRACVEAQSETARLAAELEDRRRALADALAGPRAAPKPGAAIPRPTLRAAAERLPEAVRARVLAAGERLKETLAALHAEHETVRRASLALAAHMDGLVRQVARRLSLTGVYGRAGDVDAGRPVAAALDLST